MKANCILAWFIFFLLPTSVYANSDTCKRIMSHYTFKLTKAMKLKEKSDIELNINYLKSLEGQFPQCFSTTEGKQLVQQRNFLGKKLLLGNGSSSNNRSSSSSSSDNNSTKKLVVKVIYTYKGKVYTGYIISELKTSYLFRTMENKTITIPLKYIKSIKTLSEQGSRSDDSSSNRRDDTDRGSRKPSYGELMLRYNNSRRSIALPLLLNLFIPFAIGSWVVGDTAGGVVGLIGQLGGTLLLVGGTLALSAGLIIIGSIVQFVGWLVPVITGPIHVSRENKKLKSLIFGNDGFSSLPANTDSSWKVSKIYSININF